MCRQAHERVVGGGRKKRVSSKSWRCFAVKLQFDQKCKGWCIWMEMFSKGQRSEVPERLFRASDSEVLFL